MNKKNLIVALAAAAVAGIVSAGQANADIAPFDTPFADPGCACAGLLPGPIVTHQMRNMTLILSDPDAADAQAALDTLAATFQLG